jgi:peptidoglycan/LPS O-acetylase OafA/YrhL
MPDDRARMIQLDSLRALAVGSVMLYHFYDASILARFLPLGSAGVRLFFVISGFLITGILMKGRPTAEFVAGFYLRRAMRLFPLYYLVVAVLFIVSDDARAHWLAYSSYGVNFCIAAEHRWCVAAHFWSLAVEEQFYLLWPFAVLLLDGRRLAQLCIGLVIAALAYRIAAVLVEGDRYAAYVLLPGQVDALAGGALLACAARIPAGYARWFGPVALLSLVATVMLHRIGGVVLNYGVIPSIALPALCFLVYGGARGFRGVPGAVLDNRVLRYLGTISYGIYVIHYFMPDVLPSLPMLDAYGRAAIYGGVTVLLAALSWRVFEQPINRMRERVEIARLARKPAA